MPVGTQGSVKAVSPHELHELNVSIVLGNTYHLFVRPGIEVIKHLGGLHKIMWTGARHSYRRRARWKSKPRWEAISRWCLMNVCRGRANTITPQRAQKRLRVGRKDAENG